MTRQPFNDSQSANHIENHNNVNLSDLQKQISDLKNIVFSHVLKNSANKQDKQYNSVFSDSTKAGHKTSKGVSKNKRRKNRRNTSGKRRAAKERELNEKFLRNLSTHQLSDDQVNVLSRGLKFIPTPVTNKTTIRRQLLRDFEQFARRMRLQYIFHGQDKEPHPFHVKSNWMPPVQQSIALESYLESVKPQLADIRIDKPKNNLHGQFQELFAFHLFYSSTLLSFIVLILSPVICILCVWKELTEVRPERYCVHVIDEERSLIDSIRNFLCNTQGQRKISDPGENRTDDLRIRSPLLYRLSYKATKDEMLIAYISYTDSLSFWLILEDSRPINHRQSTDSPPTMNGQLIGRVSVDVSTYTRPTCRSTYRPILVVDKIHMIQKDNSKSLHIRTYIYFLSGKMGILGNSGLKWVLDKVLISM